jgi:fibronectin type 3 domain-containing protein
MTLQAIRHYLMIPALLLLLAPVGGCGGTTSPPSAPANLTVSSTVSQNTLTWSTVPGCVYNVYRGTASSAETAIVGSYVTTYTDTPPVTSTATTYYYFVTALDSTSNESSPSTEVAVVSPALTLGAVTSTSVALNWTMAGSTSGITGYNVYRSATSGTEATPVLATPTTMSYNDTSVTHGSTYYYRVTALGPNGESFGSNEIKAAP